MYNHNFIHYLSTDMVHFHLLAIAGNAAINMGIHIHLLF